MRRFLALVLCVSLLLGGCQPAPTQTIPQASPQQTNPAQSEQPAATLPAQGNEPETRTDEQIAADAAEAQKDLEAIFPDAKFKKDKDKAVSLDYTGEAAELSVTDDAGLTWTLSIPEGALALPTTITMTPLTDVSDGMGRRSGVLFGPSGLVFGAPATLSVTGPNADKALLLVADEKGRDMMPAGLPSGKSGAEAPLFHFSTAFADAPLEIKAKYEEFKGEIDSLYNKYIDKARTLLEKQMKPPKPMNLKLQCFGDNDLDRIKEEVNKAVKEETEYATALIAVMCADYLEGNHTRYRELEPLVRALVSRARQKLDFLVSLDNPKPESYFYAFQSMMVYMGLIAYDGLNDLMGPDTKTSIKDIPGNITAYFQKVHAAGEYTWQYLLDGIAKEHEYRYISAALVAEMMLHETDRIANAAKLKTKTTDEQRRQQLSNACTFTVYFEGTTTQKRDSTATWTTSGEGKLSLEQFLGDETIKGLLMLKGTAKGTHDRYSSTDPAAVKTLLTKEFETEVHLALELPCCLTAWAGVSQFGADELTYQSDDGPITAPSFYNLINQLALGEYYDVQLQAVMADMTLVPGKALAEKTIDGKHEYTTIEYTIFLEHTPQ